MCTYSVFACLAKCLNSVLNVKAVVATLLTTSENRWIVCSSSADTASILIKLILRLMN